MKMFTKYLISFVILMSAQSLLAETPNAGQQESKESHHDWNRVFPQPTPNLARGTIPDQTKIIAPDFMAQISGTGTTLKWEQVPGVFYHLQVATDPNFKWLVTNQPLIKSNEFEIKDLKPGQQYFWRVYTQNPENKNGYTKSTAVRSAFTTAP